MIVNCLIRLFSSDYKKERLRLAKIDDFQNLASGVTAFATNRAALLAIQDFAYQTCTKRLKKLSEGESIQLLSGEGASLMVNDSIKELKSMADIYLKVKNLRHGRQDLPADQEKNSIFRQLNDLEKISKAKNALPSKNDFNNFSEPVKEAIIQHFRVRLDKFIEAPSNEKDIKTDFVIRQALSLLNTELNEWYREEDWWGNRVLEMNPIQYEGLAKAYNFLETHSHIPLVCL